MTPRFGCIAPDTLRFSAVPAWAEANPVLPEDEWEEHDDLAQFSSPIEAQQNNNCTDASLSHLTESVFRSVGIELPRLSWSFLYAHCNGGRDQGAMCREVISKAMSIGKVPESLWRDERIFLPRQPLSPEILAKAAEVQLLEVYQCMNWADVGSALTRRFHVYHGFVLGRNFQASSDGIVPEWDGRRANGHAMWSRGLRKTDQWRTVTPNTWGESFGDDGVGYWPKSYFWEGRGNYINLDCYAVRSVKHRGALPEAA